MVRIGVRNGDLSERRLRYLAQLGVEDVFVDQTTEAAPNRLPVAVDDVPSVERLAEVRETLAAHGLRFAGIQSLSGAVYDDIMFGREGAEAATAAVEALIENLGEAGIGVLGYQWNPRAHNVATRTGTETVRGGAEGTAFDLAAVERPDAPAFPGAAAYTEAELWEHYEGFLEAVLPVAERAGVDLALHPADPPTVAELEGVPRLFRNPASFERALSAVPSDAHGLKLCLGCFSQMGEDAVEVIERFGDDIVFVHFRDVVGSMPSFHETFVDCGNFDAAAAMDALETAGFEGAVLPDHVPAMEGDTDWGHRARGYTVGYLKGLREG
jgi:mannonate dehydratase